MAHCLHQTSLFILKEHIERLLVDGSCKTNSIVDMMMFLGCNIRIALSSETQTDDMT